MLETASGPEKGPANAFRIGELMRTTVPTNPGGIPSPTAEKLLAKAGERYTQEGLVLILSFLPRHNCLVPHDSARPTLFSKPLQFNSILRVLSASDMKLIF